MAPEEAFQDRAQRLDAIAARAFNPQEEGCAAVDDLARKLEITLVEGRAGPQVAFLGATEAAAPRRGCVSRSLL
jgi:hypothetical protein